MTKQEQIEEMAVIGCVRNPQAHTAEECGKCDFKQGQCNAYRHAEELYKAGYRKTPDDIRELIDVLSEGAKLKEKLDEFATNLKTHILAVMLSGDKISCKDISNAKVILYYINRQLNDTFGLNEPLNAANQFLAEPDLVKKYQLDEFLEEHKDD